MSIIRIIAYYTNRDITIHRDWIMTKIKNLLVRLKTNLCQRFYIVGFIENSSIDYFSKTKVESIHWIKYPDYKKNWLADPFILDTNPEKIILLAEQWVHKENKGRIVKVTIDRKTYSLLSIESFLHTDTHLSFPNIYREDNKIYIYPENHEAKLLQIYPYNPMKGHLEQPIVLLDEPIIDAQIIKKGSYYYIFATKRSHTCDEASDLFVYSSLTLTGPYKEHFMLKGTSRTERGAGEFIVQGETIIRPVQDCIDSYGAAVIFKAVDFTQGKIKEKEIGKLTPADEFPEGLHTFNRYNDIVVVDGIGFVAGRIVSILKRIIKNVLL